MTTPADGHALHDGRARTDGRALADRRAIAAARLAAQKLAGEPLAEPAAVVRHMLAMQAQDYAGSLWSVALRAAGTPTAADVEAALARSEIVRSWPMRGTLHLVAPEDLRWLLSLTTERLVAGAAARRRALELDDATIERARELATDALEGGRALRREELGDRFEAGSVTTGGQRLYHLLWMLSQTGTLVSGPPEGAAQTFALLEERIAPVPERERDDALGELVRRYVLSHGPATRQDLAHWSGLTAADVKTGIAVAGDAVDTAAIDGRDHLVPAGWQPVAAEAEVRLLPGFDELLLGYRDRSASLDEGGLALVVPGSNGVFQPTLSVGGHVEGLWRRRVRRGAVDVELTPLGRPPSQRILRAATREAARYARHLGLAPGEVTVPEA
ncbi:winged helix DNA-binding domain-containing protein [Desertivibrio insolitus]|uniref:winged helix DNA-binding domain-containing protein n=1 Tax=Herbiconiux sp. SYSU D00978 TaxID=2812562 RepID=UPI001A97C503|nr:winged helix DNA-binding domain-containing protein [Herbiconiux sp. SYSU D00978]